MPARHKGIPSDATLDRFWPHHAVVPRENCTGDNFYPAHNWSKERGAADRRHPVARHGGEFLVFRFKDEQSARDMCATFGGETYNALDRGKGSGWEKWRKKPTLRKAR